MNIQELRKTDLIILEHIKGSTLYGTNTPESDIDIGGIFIVPNKEWLSLQNPHKEIGDKKGDEKYYELRRYFELACTANPTVLETMFVPKEFVRIIKPQAELLMDNAEIFITKKCHHSYSGYAFAQIKKAKGKNKKVHKVSEYCDEEQINLLKESLKKGSVSQEWVETRFNKHLFSFLIKDGSDLPENTETDWKEMDKFLPQLSKLQSPKREDFCYKITDDFELRHWNPWALDGYCSVNMPFRPKNISKEELKQYDCSSVEHISNLYRIYKNGSGIFKDGRIYYTSISKEREWKDFAGILYFNEAEYNKQKREWLSFYEWMANRNESRWKSNDGDKFTFDHKNMQHTIRLLMEAENIAVNGKPIVRFSGKNLAYLREIREGIFDYDYLLKWAEDKCDELKELYDKSDLPYSVDMNKANELYMEIINA